MPLTTLRPAVTLEMQPGDVLVLLSDGIYEYASADGEEFGEERVREVVARPPRRDGRRRCAPALLAAVQAFAKGAPQEDDMTLVLVRRDGGRRERGPALPAQLRRRCQEIFAFTEAFFARQGVDREILHRRRLRGGRVVHEHGEIRRGGRSRLRGADRDRGGRAAASRWCSPIRGWSPSTSRRRRTRTPAPADRAAPARRAGAAPHPPAGGFVGLRVRCGTAGKPDHVSRRRWRASRRRTAHRRRGSVMLAIEQGAQGVVVDQGAAGRRPVPGGPVVPRQGPGHRGARLLAGWSTSPARAWACSSRPRSGSSPRAASCA